MRKHIKQSFSSEFSQAIRGGKPFRLDDIDSQMPILPEGTQFCRYLGRYDCCNKKICFDNVYCGVRNFLDKKQRAEERGYNWNFQ